jgi:RNA polymerase sigma-70 factor (ECF subfamily)
MNTSRQMVGGSVDPEIEHAWRLHYRRIAPGLVAFLAAQGVARPADAVVPLLLDAARRLDRLRGESRALRLWAFMLAHKAVVRARLRAGGAPNLGPMLLDRLSTSQRDVLLLKLLAGLSTEQVAVVVGKQERTVTSLERHAFEALAKIFTGKRRISDEDVATLIAGDAFPCDESLLPLAAALEGLRTDLVQPAPVHIEDQHLATIAGSRTKALSPRL